MHRMTIRLSTPPGIAAHRTYRSTPQSRADRSVFRRCCAWLCASRLAWRACVEDSGAPGSCATRTTPLEACAAESRAFSLVRRVTERSGAWGRVRAAGPPRARVRWHLAPSAAGVISNTSSRPVMRKILTARGRAGKGECLPELACVIADTHQSTERHGNPGRSRRTN